MSGGLRVPELIGTASPEADSRRRLVRFRLLATGLVTLMAAIYALTLLVPEPGFVILLVRAGAEAGVVGGLADWFAVTALFRHPLGLPFPHTAVIPNNQLRIGQSLGRFVERNFITRDLVVRKVREMEVGRRTAEWLTSADASRTVTQWLVDGVPALLRGVENEDLRAFLQRAVGDRVRTADPAPILGQALRSLVATREAEVLIDRVLVLLHDQVERHRSRILDMVADRSAWWVPKAVDRRIAEGIADGLSDLVTSFQLPASESRNRLRQAIEKFADDLVNDSRTRDAVNNALANVASSPELRAWIGSVWQESVREIAAVLEDPNSNTRQALEKSIRAIGDTMVRDREAIAFIDRVAQRGALIAVARRQQVASVVTEVVKSWDAESLSRRLELAVGSDLQYIRINGTLVGAVVGCAIFTLSRLLGFNP